MHSIRVRLTALFIVVTTAALAIFGIYGYYRLSHELDTNFTQLIKGTVSRLTISLPAPMWDLNTEVCKTILEAEMMPPEVQSIQVFDATNQLFVGTTRDKEGHIFSGAEVNAEGCISEDAPLFRQTDTMVGAGGVQQSGPAIGHVVVHFSRHRIEKTLRGYALQSIFEVLSIDVLLLLVLTFSLRMIFRPLGRLRDALHALAYQDKEEIPELPETQRNEFGEVVKGFNETLRKMKQIIERHRKAEEAAQKAMDAAESEARALAESKLQLEMITEDLQHQVADSAKMREALLNSVEDLEASKKEAESIVHKINAMSQAVNDALVMIDGDGKVMFWNEAAEKLFGFTVSEAMGMDFHEMAAPVDIREKARAGVKAFGATGQGSLFGAAVETIAVNRYGETFPVEVNLSSFQLDGKWFAVGTVRDITERTKADALKVGKEVAEEAAARAEKARIEAEQAQEELRVKILEIERFNKLATGREHRIIDLKRQVNALMKELGRNAPFQSPEQVEEQALSDTPDTETQNTLGAAEIKLEFINLLQKNALHELFTHFCNVAGVPAAIIDLDANVLASSPWQRVCTDFHRVNKTSCARCIESDTNLSTKLMEGKDYAIYRCKNGMTDCASPIIINGHHIANVFIGQFHLAEPDDGFFAKQADELGFDRSEYLQAVHEAPVMDEARLPNILGFLSRFTKLIGSFAVEQWRARQAELNIHKHVLTVQMERAAAMSLAEDANQARLEIERFKEHLELLVRERTEELSAAEELSRLILASVNEGIFGMNTEGRVMFVNSAASRVLGYTEEEMRDKLIHAEFHYAYPDGSNYPEAKCPMYLSSQDGKPRIVDNEVLWRKDGKAVPVEYTAMPVWKEDQVIGTVVSFRDITERKQAENELKERMEELERFSRLTIHREARMIQLKEEINSLLEQTGKEKKYKIVE
ncbi:MAG: PocR ligand-binding domain-containing protein [Chloroflexota bacterium]